MPEVLDDLKVKELDDGSLQVGEPEPEPKEEAEGGSSGDERLTKTEESDDETGHSEETEEEAKARTERNRARRAQNKASRKEYVESLKRDLASRDSIINDLASRVAAVEQHSTGNQVAQIDAAITEAANFYNHFKTVNQKAIELADGATAVDAQEKMFAAQNRHQMLLNAKKNLTSQVTKAPPLDPRMVTNAKSWIESHPWYDASGADADSDLVMRIDNRLVQEGMNPSTSEYWEELDARVKKYLPHRVIQSYNKPQAGEHSPRSRSPVAGSGTESNATGKSTYRLSAERVTALKEAGVYDNPKKLADAIKRYQQFDKENSK